MKSGKELVLYFVVVGCLVVAGVMAIAAAAVYEPPDSDDVDDYCELADEYGTDYMKDFCTFLQEMVATVALNSIAGVICFVCAGLACVSIFIEIIGKFVRFPIIGAIGAVIILELICLIMMPVTVKKLTDMSFFDPDLQINWYDEDGNQVDVKIFWPLSFLCMFLSIVSLGIFCVAKKKD